jgi:glycosyltransferase involved in cell wall biosynthesis
MQYEFSIIVPTYNRGDKLKIALDSLVNQSFKNFEVIICDDGSIDNTEIIVNNYTQSLNLVYLKNTNWGGPARPRNLGISKSSGKWVCFLDSDDWWYPNKLEYCSEYTNQNDFIYHYLDVYNSKLNKIINKKIGLNFIGNMLNCLLVKGNCIPNSSVLINRKVLLKAGKFSEDKSKIAIEDFDLWLRVAQITNKFKFINKSLGVYNWENDTNISQISVGRIEKEKSIFFEYFHLLSQEDKIIANSNFSYKIGRYYYLIGKSRVGKFYLLKSLSFKNIINTLKSLFFLFYYKLK